ERFLTYTISIWSFSIIPGQGLLFLVECLCDMVWWSVSEKTHTHTHTHTHHHTPHPPPTHHLTAPHAHTTHSHTRLCSPARQRLLLGGVCGLSPQHLLDSALCARPKETGGVRVENPI